MVNFVLPEVQVIGVPHYRHPMDGDEQIMPFPPMSIEGAAPSAAMLAEFAGRSCYQSFDRPSEKTARNKDYLANILSQHHYSVLEHAQFSFYVTGISRSLLGELTRHRHLMFSVLSQRFVDSSDVNFVIPPAIITDPEAIAVLKKQCASALDGYVLLERIQRGKGLTKKQARESARSVLPNATETRLVVSGNMNAWLQVIVKRDNPAADAEIQRLFRLIGDELARLVPNVFGPEARMKWDDSFAQGVAREANEMVTKISEIGAQT